MELKDILIAPFFLGIIYLWAYLRKKKQVNPLTKRYYFGALHLRILGMLAFALIYQFYYGGGDTFNFFHDSQIVWQALMDKPDIGLQILTAKAGELNPATQSYVNWMYFYVDKNSMVVIRTSAVLGVITYHTYLANAIFFAFYSFTGMWAMYKAFVDMYPMLYKKLAFAVFAMPSTFFWGSGLMKDSIIVGALGWSFYAFYFGILKREFLVKNIVIFIVSLWIMQLVKIYVAMSFLPAAAFWLLLNYRAKVKTAVLRALLLPLLILFALPIGYVAVSQLTEGTRYSFDEIGATTKTNTEWNEISGNAAYSLGEYDGSIGSVISKFPAAIFVSLFQPFLWQARNVVMLLAASQATFILFLTLQTFFKAGFKFFSLLFKQPFLAFCLVFTLTLAFGTGVGSGNYGSLDRYRIPFIPFYISMMFIVQYYAKKPKKLV
ncbi:MAG: hypothetical protein SFU27_05885 [Thermonemataceae bacterium]|nr:hypothetical protein [Thermonemataceae bacterium]